MRRRALALALATGALSLAPAMTANAASPNCMADLASNLRNNMPHATLDWQQDFLNLDQPPGAYAVHLTRTGLPDCPG